MATLIAFFFFALSFHFRPFKKSRLNAIKLFSEFQIYGILLVCLIVQVHDQGFDSEFVTIDAYGVIQTALVIAIVPVILYFLVVTFHDLKTGVKDGMDEFSHRHDHSHVSEAEDHDKISTLQDENTRLCEQEHENADQRFPSAPEQATQKYKTIEMNAEAAAKEFEHARVEHERERKLAAVQLERVRSQMGDVYRPVPTMLHHVERDDRQEGR
jgi:hypothetical protein